MQCELSLLGCQLCEDVFHILESLHLQGVALIPCEKYVLFFEARHLNSNAYPGVSYT
jgi:hypothetical protein